MYQDSDKEWIVDFFDLYNPSGPQKDQKMTRVCFFRAIFGPVFANFMSNFGPKSLRKWIFRPFEALKASQNHPKAFPTCQCNVRLQKFVSDLVCQAFATFFQTWAFKHWQFQISSSKPNINWTSSMIFWPLC